MSLTEKEKLLLEQLEAERERRIDERVEKGEAVRVPLPILVVGVSRDGDLDEHKKARAGPTSQSEPPLAATNKCLAKSNKSRTVGEATKKRNRQ